MAANSIKINEKNFYEWLCSTGYLLPRNELELARFERLHPSGSFSINEEAINPFAIINGTRKRVDLSISIPFLQKEDQEELRMAARKNAQLPPELLDQIKKNQLKKRDGNGNKSTGES
jgi:hypothetical protein